MSATRQEIAWDRRRGDRRAETSSGRDRRAADSPAGRFEAYLDAKVGALERSAAVAAAEIRAEATRLRLDFEAGSVEAENLDGLAQRATRAVEHIAEDIARMRAQFGVTERNGNGAPSEGAELLVRQLAISGADASEIEQELAKLGMKHPRGAIEAVLAEPS